MAKDYKNKKGATGKKYTTVGDVIKVTYTDGSTRVVRPTDASYAVTKKAMQDDISSKKLFKSGNSKTTAQTALGANSAGAGVVTTAKQKAQQDNYRNVVNQRRAQEQAVSGKLPAQQTAQVVNNAINAMLAQKAVNTAKGVTTKALKSGVEHGVHNTVSGLNQGMAGALNTLGRAGMVEGVPYAALANNMAKNLDIQRNYQKAMDTQRIGMGQLQKNLAMQDAVKRQQIASKYGPMTGGEQFVSDIVSNLIPIAPSMAAGVIGGGVAPALGTVAAMAPMYTYARGLSTGQALQDGATVNQANAYGIGKGVVETGTEMLTKNMAGLPGKFEVGKKLADAVTSPTAKKVGAAAGDILSGAGEEALAELADPFLQNATYKDGEKIDMDAVLYSALLGGVMTGGVNAAAYTAKNVAKMMQEAKNGQLNSQKQAQIAQKPQNTPEQAQNNATTKGITAQPEVAQEQTSQADFQQNQAKIVQEAQPVKNVQNGGKKEESAVENLQNEMKNLRYQQLQFVSDMIDKVRSGHEPTNTEQKRIDRILERLGIEEAFYGSDISVIDDKIAEEMAAYENRNGIEAGERQMQKTVAEQSPMIETENAAAEEPSMVEYEDYDARKLSRDVFDFYSQVGKVGGKAHFNIRVVQKLEHDAEGKSDGRGNILISAERANDIEIIRRVVAHEVYHEMKNTPEWGNIQDLAYELYKLEYPDGTQEDMLQAKIDQYYKLSKGAVQLDFDAAWDEIGAEMMGKILSNPKMADRVWNQNPTLAQRIKRWLEDMVAKLYDYVTISGEDSIYRRALEAYSEGLRNMEYRRGAALEGGTNSSSLDADNDNANVNVTNEAGEVVAEQRGSEIRFSLGSHEDGGRDVLHQYVDEMVKKGKMDADFGKTVIEQLETMYKSIKKLTQGSNADKYSYFTAWSEVMPQFDENGKLILSVATPNGEYPMNLDFSTRCAKRVAIDTLLMHMSASGIYDISQLTPSDFAMINQILKDHNLATACTMCFVETKRDRSAGWANTIVDEYNELLQAANIKNGVVDEASLMAKRKEMDGRKENKTSMAMSERYAKYLRANANNPIQLKASDLMHSEGMERVKREAPDIYSIASSRYGAGTPKPLTAEGAYANELINPDKKRKQKGGKKKNPYIWKAEDAFKVGGVRLQSFSDFRVEMFFDYCQMIAEASLKGLPIQSYTKVPAFAKLFGMTGIKINLSLVPEVELTAEERAYVDSLTDKQKKTDARFKEIQGRAGLNSKGEYLWAGESFDPKLAYRLQDNDMYTNNVGTVAIGVSDAQIWQMLKDKNIRMIIPYHKSGIDAGVARAKNIDVFKNYESYQNHLIIDENLPMMPNESYAQYYRRLANMDKYGSKPTKKGFNFDFYGALKKLNDPVKVSKQYVDECQKRNIAPKFPQFVYNQDGSFNENYYKMLIDFAVYNKDGKYAPQQAVKFDSEHLPKDWLKTLRKELAIDESERKRMDSEIASVADDVVSRLKPKKDSMYSLPAKQLDKNYMDAVNNGDMETAQRMVDDVAVKAGARHTPSGKPIYFYHGTGAEFTVFDEYAPAKHGRSLGAGFYLTAKKELAEHYSSGRLMKNYVMTENYAKSGDMNITKDQVRAFISKMERLQHDWYTDDLYGFGEADVNYAEKLADLYDGWADTSILVDLSKRFAEYNDEDTSYDFSDIAYETFGYKGLLSYGELVLWDNRLIKSADTVVYDDNGEAIPLSQRFNKDNPDIRYSMNQLGGNSGKSRYQELVDKYGAIKPGENPFDENRDIPVPQQTSDWDKTRQWTRTAMESGNIDDTTVGMIASDLTDDMQTGRFIYEPSSNREQVGRANNLIQHTGWQEQARNFRNKYRSGERMTADDIALGEVLILEAQRAGDYDTAVQLIADVAALGTEAGRAVQALKILKRLSPEGRVMALKRIEARINASLIKQGREPIALPEGAAQRMLQARGEDKQAEIWDDTIKEMAEQVPATFADKVNAWRYLSMLSNPRTHIRNMMGNAVMRSVMGVKNLMQTGVEAALAKNSERTAAILVPKEYRDFAKWDYENHAKQMLAAGGGRYNDEIGLIAQNKRIFNNPALEGARKLNSGALEFEDMLFKKAAYIDALSRYMYANKLSPSVLQSQASAVGASYERGQNFAVEQARKATFQEASKLAQKLAEIENMNNASKVFWGAVMPFKKTPINILKRGIEYSPLGVMNGVKKFATDVRSGKATPAEAIDELTAGMTGTMIVALGYYMASQGLLSGGADDDDQRKARYDQQMGNQNYAFVFPDGSTYTIDWLAPSVMPLMVGAELHKQMNGNVPDNDNATVFTRGLEAIAKVGNPVMEMSMLSGLTDALQSYNSGTGQFLSDVFMSAASNYGGQFIPAPMGAVARAIDGTVRSSYAPKDSPYTKGGEAFARQMANRIPVVSQYMQPSIDVWGNERKREGDTVAERLLHNMFNPGNYSSNKRTELDDKLTELYEATGDSGVMPNFATNYIKVGGVTYQKTPEEKTTYDRTKGQKSKQYVSDFVNSSAYAGLDDSVKAKIVADLYDLANYEAKKEMLSNLNLWSEEYEDSSYEKVLAAGVSPGEYYSTRRALDNKYNYDDAVAILDELTSLNLSPERYLEVMQATSDINSYDSNGKSKKGLKKQRIQAKAAELGLTAQQASFIYKMSQDNWRMYNIWN